MPLRLVLRPGETLVINGAHLSAGDRAAILYLHNEATFLRGREVLRPEEVDGPERALYLAIQERYLGSDQADRVGETLAALLEVRGELAAELGEVALLVREGRFYRALKAAARLFPGGAPSSSSGADASEPQTEAVGRQQPGRPASRPMLRPSGRGPA